MDADRNALTPGSDRDMGSEHLWCARTDAAWTWADDDTAVVMALDSGLPLRLSPTGSLVWEVLLGGRSPEDLIGDPPLAPLREEEVVAQVAAACDLAPEVVSEGVLAFLGILEQRGIVTRA